MSKIPTLEPLEVESDTLASWREDLSKIKFDSSGASFIDLRCGSGLCATRFLVMELPAIIRAQRTDETALVYILPDQTSMDIVKSVIGDADATGFDIMTPAELVGQLAEDFDLRDSVFVFDAGRGLHPTNVVVAATAVAEHWARLRAAGEKFNGTLIVVKPQKDNVLWSETALRVVFGTAIESHCLFNSWRPADKEPVTHNNPSQSFDSFLADIVTEALYLGAGRAARLKHTVVVVMLHDSQIADVMSEMEFETKARASMIKKYVAVGGIPERSRYCFAMTPTAFRGGWEAVQQKVRDLGEDDWLKLVLFVSPSMRFLPPINGCEYIHITTRRQLVSWDQDMGSFFQESRSWGLTERSWIADVGRPLVAGKAHVIAVAEDDHNRGVPENPLEGAGEFLAETLLCHINTCGNNRPAMPSLLRWPTDHYMPMELLRRLHQVKLVKADADILRDLRITRHGLRLPHTRLGVPGSAECARVASLIMDGTIKSLPEARLLVAAQNSNSKAVQQHLIGVVALRQVGERSVFRPREGQHPPTPGDCKKYCWVGGRLESRGRLWLVLSMCAKIQNNGPIPSTLGNLRVSKAGYNALVSEHQRLCRAVKAPGELCEFRLAQKDELELEIAMVNAWLFNLVPLPQVSGPLTVFRDLTTALAFQNEGGWGTEMRSQPGLNFALHFGLRRHNSRTVADDMIVVSSEAVSQVLKALFPDATDGNYEPFLKTQYPFVLM